MHLLITAFGPFPGVPRNPSEKLARMLASNRAFAAKAVAVSVRVFPTAYAGIGEQIVAAVAETRPDAVLMLGVASRRRHLSVEKQGANRASLIHRDADGRKPSGLLLERGSPAFRPARAPVVRLAAAGARTGFPSRVSRSAGTYLCNASYYLMLGALPAHVSCVFLHIPKTQRRDAFARLERAVLTTTMVMLRR